MNFYRISPLILVAVLVLGAGCLEVGRSPEGLHQPLDRSDNRPKLLTFGLYVTPDPEQNPIDPPERFTGFHSALDYEVFGDEIGQDVKVYAICDGEVVYRNDVEGYGGTFIQQCVYQGQEVTVLYGHLDLASIEPELKDALKAGDVIGILGEHKTAETSDNRMHLHLGIHKGTDIELRGYVQNESELEAFIDPSVVFDYE
ncbi:MAG: M23 family metallopeptidase [Patescibacteria group bacterium]